MIKARCECGNMLEVIDVSGDIVLVKKCKQCETNCKSAIFKEMASAKKEMPKKT